MVTLLKGQNKISNSCIGHTRWATHGEPTAKNAHPHVCNNCVAIVHNGIIENHEELREQQIKDGFTFTSDTDTEVIVHQIQKYLSEDISLFDAVRKSINDLDGAYALGVISTSEPDTLICARKGSPLVIGLGEHENFIASDIDSNSIASATRSEISRVVTQSLPSNVRSIEPINTPK